MCGRYLQAQPASAGGGSDIWPRTAAARGRCGSGPISSNGPIEAAVDDLEADPVE